MKWTALVSAMQWWSVQKLKVMGFQVRLNASEAAPWRLATKSSSHGWCQLMMWLPRHRIQSHVYFHASAPTVHQKKTNLVLGLNFATMAKMVLSSRCGCWKPQTSLPVLHHQLSASFVSLCLEQS
jgi:hypothetical protein